MTFCLKKKECYPQSLQVSEDEARIDPLDQVKFTFKRIISKIEYNFIEGQEFNIHLKYGCDGMSIDSLHKQKFSDSDMTDKSIFSSVIVFMIITTGDEVVYHNEKPNSPFNCRPIKISYRKETSELIRSEIEYLRNEFSQPFSIDILGKKVKIQLAI